MTLVHSLDEAASLPGGPDRELLGGKAAGLAGMVAAGLPVPPGFTLTTRAGRAYLSERRLSGRLRAEVAVQLAGLEQRTGRSFGRGPVPLLVSVRSGAPSSMPGMMDTLLNVGLTEEAAAAWARLTGDAAFVAQSMTALADGYAGLGLTLSTGDPMDQLFQAIEAVFASWESDRAVAYRRLRGLPEHGATAVTVQAMVHGDLPGPGPSGTGVLFTRDPATGAPEPVGEFLRDGLGSALVDGARTPGPLDDLARLAPDLHGRLLEHAAWLEREYRDMCDIEFTIENGTLWLLQVRPGKRTDEAAVRVAVDLADEGVIDRAEAVRRAAGRLTGGTATSGKLGLELCRGIAASPGIGSGHPVFDPDTAQDLAAEGRPVVLVRDFTEPADVHGMAAATAIVTRTGGKTSHAAVVARELGVPCVCGAQELRIDTAGEAVWARGHRVGGEALVTVDGSRGLVYEGSATVVAVEPTEPHRRLAAWRREHGSDERP